MKPYLLSLQAKALLATAQNRNDAMEGGWITINGAHVLIGTDGKIKAGAGGKFNGQTKKQVEAGASETSSKPSETAKEKPPATNKEIPKEEPAAPKGFTKAEMQEKRAKEKEEAAKKKLAKLTTEQSALLADMGHIMASLESQGVKVGLTTHDSKVAKDMISGGKYNLVDVAKDPAMAARFKANGETLQKVIAGLPPKTQAMLKKRKLSMIPLEMPDGHSGCASSVGGEAMIALRINRDRELQTDNGWNVGNNRVSKEEQAKATVIHELGHILHGTSLVQAKKVEAVVKGLRDSIPKETGASFERFCTNTMKSRYSMTNAMEFLAESFAHYHMNVRGNAAAEKASPPSWLKEMEIFGEQF
jgi:hypothetical protein